MLALFALILVITGCANWLTIGLLQFDFVAGLFGSQSNIFSRIVYVIIGVAAVILTINIIKNKGKIGFNFKKLKFKKAEPTHASQMESSGDLSKNEDPKTSESLNKHEEKAVNSTTGPESHPQSNFKNISEKLSQRHEQNNHIKK